MKYQNILLITISSLLTGCTKNSDEQLTKDMISTKTLLFAINDYTKTHSELPVSVVNAVKEFKDNISGDIPVNRWEYIIIKDSYILICKRKSENKLIFGYPPNEVRIINLDE